MNIYQRGQSTALRMLKNMASPIRLSVMVSIGLMMRGRSDLSQKRYFLLSG